MQARQRIGSGNSPVAIPSGTTVTAISTLFEDKLLVFYGFEGKLHAVSLDGDILMSWDAQGQDLGQGDVAFFVRPNGTQWILQTDGRGFLYLYDPFAIEAIIAV